MARIPPIYGVYVVLEIEENNESYETLPQIVYTNTDYAKVITFYNALKAGDVNLIAKLFEYANISDIFSFGIVNLTPINNSFAEFEIEPYAIRYQKQLNGSEEFSNEIFTLAPHFLIAALPEDITSNEAIDIANATLEAVGEQFNCKLKFVDIVLYDDDLSSLYIQSLKELKV